MLQGLLALGNPRITGISKALTESPSMVFKSGFISVFTLPVEQLKYGAGDATLISQIIGVLTPEEFSEKNITCNSEGTTSSRGRSEVSSTS